MRTPRDTVIVMEALVLLALISASAQAQSGCDLPSLLHQQQDEATIQHLEASWNRAISQGDADFERCLLSTDFKEILPTGELKTLADQLGSTAKNKGQNRPIPHLPPVTVSIHGNVAVAYATWKMAGANQTSDKIVDYLIWEDGSWHVFFSQITRVENRGKVSLRWRP
jgi:Domain of unknown function (DUF4440)